MDALNKNNLQLCDWQHTIRHHETSDFTCGERVFLKSNPEYEMIVKSIDKRYITAFWFAHGGELQICQFPPEAILQYKYAGLKTYKKMFYVSLN